MRQALIITSVVFFSLFLADSALAQSAGSIPAQIPELKEQIYVDMSPENPKALDQVTISLEAYGTNLDQATITWKVNGTVAAKGQGLKVFRVQAGKSGETKTVNIAIAPPGAPLIQKTVIISPQDLDLLWEARTYIPPFYRGKAMYTPQENVVVVAMPTFKAGSGLADPSKLSYTWRKDDEVQGDQTGLGYNVFHLKGSILLSNNYIQADVTGSNGEEAVSGFNLGPITPSAIFYENNPLYGILFNNAIISNSNFTTEEKNLIAEPYFFGVSSLNDPSLTYKWTLNNSPINVSDHDSIVTFRNTNNEDGTSLIGVTIDNSKNFLEEAVNSVYVNFVTPKKIFNF